MEMEREETNVSMIAGLKHAIVKVSRFAPDK